VQNQSANTPAESQSQLTTKPAETVSQTNPQNYSLVIYPISKSPIYKSLSQDCLDKTNQLLVARTDFRLLNKRGEIIVPSLKQLVYTTDKSADLPKCYNLIIDIFSKPSSGNYLYLSGHSDLGNDAPYSGIDTLYRLDLSNLSLNKLAVTDFVAMFYLYRGGENNTYKLLTDGKRLIKWNQNGIYLINLELDTNTTLYKVTKNDWLVSNIYFEMGQVAGYDVKITNNQIEVGVYDKTRTQDGKPITIDQYDNVNYDGYYDEHTGERENDIKLKFKEKVTLTIPD
jgi:hypothetical protein